MANTIIAGNATNNGLAFTSDNTGTLNILSGSGSGTTALAIDASQNVTVTGTLTATNGVSGALRSGTAVAATSGTSIDFTSIPTGVKRVTVMFNGVSTGSTNNFQIQLGTGATPTYTISGYAGLSCQAAGNTVFSTGFIVNSNITAAGLFSGAVDILLLSGTTYIERGVIAASTSINGCFSAGNITLGAALTAIRVIASATGSPSDTFDAGSINILYE